MNTDITIYQGDDSQAIVSYTPPAHYILSLDACVAAWLKTKSERTGSAKTKRAYQDTINGFRALLQAARPIPLDLDSTDGPTTIICGRLDMTGHRVISSAYASMWGFMF